MAFGVFCAVASGTYFINDAIDAEADRQHPTKRRRPVASGLLSRNIAIVTGGGLMALGIGVGTAMAWRLGVVLVIYVALQLAYTLSLKHEPIFDLVAIAAGFVLRAIAGAVAVPVPVSEWFLIVATFGSLLMVTGKRLAEHAELGADRGNHRPALDEYSQTFLRTVLAISAGGAIIGYCFWAFSLQTALSHHRDAIWYQLSIVPDLHRPVALHLPGREGEGGQARRAGLQRPPLQVLGARVGAALRVRGLRQLAGRPAARTPSRSARSPSGAGPSTLHRRAGSSEARDRVGSYRAHGSQVGVDPQPR